ncbi:MAG: hypothetical protein LBB16_01990 [Puniceicoccales bacterium]|jgi:hypothetical protein|nr:hypothetical protein [Puniceicoccales bacterium]
MNFEKYFPLDENNEGYSFSLNEKDWRSYLAAIDTETGKFFKLFIESRHISNHLDMIFAAMQWRKIIFTSNRLDSGDSIEIVTFHKNPVYIASKAIFFFMEKIWDISISEGKSLTITTCWHFAKLINAMQKEMFGGIASIDSCEYVLAVCHFKNVMAVVNDAMFSLRKLPPIGGKAAGFIHDFAVSLFDVRELAWQSISLCNVAEKRCNEGS